MAFPLATPTFYRMPGKFPASTGISDLIDAIHAGLNSATDYRGTSLPSTHLWTWTKAGTPTATVYGSPPSGTSMTMTPRLIWAGHTATTGTMASPDTWLTSGLHGGIVKNAGAYNSWSAAAPFTSGQFSGYWRWAPTAANAVATEVRCYVSEETVFVQIIQAGTTQYWGYIGAIMSPFTNDTTLDAEADNRLYGMIQQGASGAVSASFLTNGSGTFLSCVDTNGTPHFGAFRPGAANWDWCGRSQVNQTTPAAAMLQARSGAYVAESPIQVCAYVSASAHTGSRIGFLRGIWTSPPVVSGRWLRNGSTDLYHFVSVDTGAAGQGLLLKAAA